LSPMTPRKKVVVGLVQASASEDRNANLKKCLRMAAEAISRGARIVCLPELYRTPYFPQWDGEDASFLAEAIPGESTQVFSALAQEHATAIIVPVFERSPNGYYNSAAVIDADGSLLETYRKVHIPHDPLFFEKGYFQPGQEFRVYKTRHASFAVLICYDQWFPEAARIAALQGAEVIFYPTAIGWIKGMEDPAEGDWREAWETVQRGHAIASGIHVAAVNRVGREKNLIFWGSSFICDSFGRVLARAGDQEEVLVAELDLGKNQEVRDGWGFLRNRRPDLYWPLVEPLEGAPSGKMEQALLGLLGNTPLRRGYRMPAEWEKHDAVWLAWPHDIDTFPDIEDVENAYASMVKELHKGELVNLLVTDELMRARAVDLLQKSGVEVKRVRFHLLNYADVWIRDYGPSFLVNDREKKLAMVAWRFNAWGEKYPGLLKDANVPNLINEDLGLECFLPGIVLEGGSVEVNGRGTVLTTEQCLLNSNRNPGWSKEEMELLLKEHLGARKVIWLGRGIAGDDTDGHVDDIARFVGPRKVLCACEEDAGDENFGPLRENYEILCRETDQDGQRLEVRKLPMPGYVGGDGRLPASYANFYIGNQVVLVPVFGHENDGRALAIIGEAFPGRRAVGIDCRAMVAGLGAIHCISQQQPAL
jgi:agmatine deiminase